MTFTLAVVSAHATEQFVYIERGSDVSVGADDDLDAYVGTGGLLLPRTFEGPARRRKQVANCLTCVWKYTLYCAQDASVACAHAVTTCEHGQLRYRVKFGLTSADVQTIGSICWDTAIPATRSQLNIRIRDNALRRVPLQDPGCLPRQTGLTNLPVAVWSGQPSEYRPAPMLLSGMRIAIRARAIWKWSWGDSSVQWTSDPGSPSTLTGLSHRYSTPGTYEIGVQSVWSATYSVSGIGTFAVDEQPINQYGHLNVHILESKTLLVHTVGTR